MVYSLIPLELAYEALIGDHSSWFLFVSLIPCWMDVRPDLLVREVWCKLEMTLAG